MTEKTVQNALWRTLRPNYHILCPNYSMPHWWEADMLGITKTGYTVEFEIKLSKSDFKADANKGRDWSVVDGKAVNQPINKLKELENKSDKGPNRFFYVLPNDLIEKVTLPDWAGLYVVYEYNNKLYVKFKRKAKLLHRVKHDLTSKLATTFYWRYWNLRTTS